MHEGRSNCSQPFGILSQPFPVFSCVCFFLHEGHLMGTTPYPHVAVEA
jgi:hypothetical protein